MPSKIEIEWLGSNGATRKRGRIKSKGLLRQLDWRPSIHELAGWDGRRAGILTMVSR